jgi:prophage regulatory protein
LRKELTPEASVQRTPSQTLSIRSEAVAPVFLRLPMVMRMTGLGRTTIYRLIANQKFPSPVRLGPRAIAWRRSDLDRWSEARPVVAH